MLNLNLDNNMKGGGSEEVEVVPFEVLPGPQVEVFGVIRKAEDPPIASLLGWQQPEAPPRPRPATGKKSEWVSEAHDAFRSYAAVAQGLLAQYQPKPIPDSAEEAENRPRARSGSPKNKEKSLSRSPKAENTANNERKASERQLERIKKLNQTTRWLPNSAFKTYFGKPIFANYGQANINPAYGGLMYGDYMKTHNIAPHEGANNPKTQQVYEVAETKALQKTAKPQILPRKCKDEDRLAPDEVDKLKKRSQILSKTKEKPSKPIVKPDLVKEKIFKSEHHTPNQSIEEPKPVAGEKKEPKAKPTVIRSQKPSLSDPKSAETVKREEVKVEKLDEVKEEEPKTIEQSEDHQRADEAKSHDAEVQAEDCDECANRNTKKLVRTAYQDMTSKLVVDKTNQVVEPFKYCARCRDELFNEDVMRPPFSLAEIPPQELNPKNYKTLPPQWTQRIPAAGKLSYRSPSAYSVIFGDNLALGSQ
jgi:hypothetical protein